MKLLLDANVSPTVATALNDAGYETTHVADVGLLRAADDEILEFAGSNDYVMITADTDFPMMLVLRGFARPSVVLLRHVSELSREEHARLLTANLPLVSDDLDSGGNNRVLEPGQIGSSQPADRLNASGALTGWLRLSSLAQARLRRERGGAPRCGRRWRAVLAHPPLGVPA